MLPLKDCRGYRSRYINALNRAVRALTPIAGRGIRLRQSAQGVVIESTAKGGGGGTVVPFLYRWKVTLSTSTDDSGATTYNLHVQPGSLWRDDGAGTVDLNVVPDGSTVTGAATATEWLVAGATSGSLYVVEDTSGGSAVYRVVYGDPTAETRRILLRVADLTLASSGATLIQRQIGDALTGGASGLQLGPLTYEVAGSTRRFVRYMGTWVYSETADAWTFAKAVKADGGQYPAAETLAAREMLIRAGGEIYVAYRPDIGPGPAKWLYRNSVRVSQGISVNPPATDTDTGSVTETTRDLTYFTDNTDANAATEEKLSIQVAEANEATAYDS